MSERMIRPFVFKRRMVCSNGAKTDVKCIGAGQMCG